MKKKMFALLIVCVLAVGMCIPAFAAENFSNVQTKAVFDVPVNTKVHITNKNYTSKYLSVGSGATVSNDRTKNIVCLRSDKKNDSQRWYIETVDKQNRLYRIECYNKTNYALNIYHTQNTQSTCDAIPWSGNRAQDYQVKIVDESGSALVSNTFGLVLPKYLKCVTPSGGYEGNPVYWEAGNGSKAQLWDITRG